MTRESSRSTSPPGERRPPTMRDVADHLGVSRQLVSLVLRGVPGPSAASRERILQGARDLGYRPNASARLLRQNRTRLIGVHFHMRNPFQVRVVERLFERAARDGFAIDLGPVTEQRGTETAVTELMEQRIEGLIAFNPDPASRALVAAMSEIPVTWLGEWVDEERADNIHVDEISGFGSVVEHLVSLGHREVVYVGGNDSSLGRERAAAYRTAMAAAGLADASEVMPGSFQEEDGAEAAREIAGRSHRPTAVVCASDQTAVGLLAVFAHAGIAVPGDISVVGFDDSYLAGLSYNSLTTVRQDVDGMVEATWQSVFSRIEGGREERRVVATPTRLVIRNSTGPARNA